MQGATMVGRLSLSIALGGMLAGTVVGAPPAIALPETAEETTRSDAVARLKQTPSPTTTAEANNLSSAVVVSETWIETASSATAIQPEPPPAPLTDLSTVTTVPAGGQVSVATPVGQPSPPAAVPSDTTSDVEPTTPASNNPNSASSADSANEAEPSVDSSDPNANPSGDDGLAEDPTNVTSEPEPSDAAGATQDAPAAGAEDAAEALLEQARRRELISEGDRLWLAGQYVEATALYREAKGELSDANLPDRQPAFADPTLLSPEGRVYWREAEAGREQSMTTRQLVALRLLVEQELAFIPGHLRFAELLIAEEKPEEAVESLERVVGIYGDEADLIHAQVDALAANNQWMESSIAARQFALLYPEHPAAPEFQAIAQENLDTFRRRLRERLTGNAIANAITGTLGFALTGGLFGPLSTLQTTLTLLRGESAIGESVSNSAARQLELIEDEEVSAYVNDIGQRLASLTGRDNFEYEFFVINNNELNAFALPGGKVFINSGAILQAESEAELAGLIAHELAHTVLSHGFQLIVEANLSSNVFQFIPYGGIAANLTTLSYSRDMERQADAFGTRLISTSGYAADGLHNLMETLGKRERSRATTFRWLSTHPDTDERLRNMATQIERNGYNRFAYEGIERHNQIRQRVRELQRPKRFEELLRESGKGLGFGS
ncbi:M48 family metalloprotease [Leptolyngbya sp. AN02str]|uniref:M48 family metallopeptidase n=1 Tax=Leptolyngbya sp. AN02str TaxID=3423363 RepID=UPI003D316B7A